MISFPGSFSFANLVIMSFATAKSAGDTRYESQDPFIQSTLVVPCNLDSNLSKECVFSTSNAIISEAR